MANLRRARSHPGNYEKQCNGSLFASGPSRLSRNTAEFYSMGEEAVSRRSSIGDLIAAIFGMLTVAIAFSAFALGCGSDSSSGQIANASPTASASCTKPGPTAGVAAGGFLVFDSAPANGSPRILEYSTSLSTGSTANSGSVITGSGVSNLVFTSNGAWTYGRDSKGNIWGYKVDFANGGGLLAAIGMVVSGLPTTSTITDLIVYRSSMLWVIDRQDFPSPPMTTVRQYRINADGTLAPPTAVTLPGFDLTPFVAPDSVSFVPSGIAPTAVWVYQQTGAILNLSVYPVNSSGIINGVALQTLSTQAILGVARVQRPLRTASPTQGNSPLSQRPMTVH
jgi:hypothetical protein